MTTLFLRADPYPWPHDGDLRPETTALLIIDMQRDFCDPKGYLSASGYDIAATRAIVPAVVSVYQEVRAWGGLVIFTREGHRPDLSDLPPLKAWRSRQAGGEIGTPGPMGRLLVRGENGWDIIDELKPQSGDVVVDKPGYSAFYGTDLERILSTRGIRHLVLTGVTTDVCVHSTLRDAVDRNYECLVVGDACAASIPENHAAALRTIATEGGIFGAVASSADVRLGSTH
ncbi:MAG: isochorismatase family cysteine hydrolase [Hyphomicrobium sp.]|uniref:cysteine hydrolase family protein n=1 Tax=Hyphomicrobium sp. TaxID=82 RepID=UPI0039E286B3